MLRSQKGDRKIFILLHDRYSSFIRSLKCLDFLNHLRSDPGRFLEIVKLSLTLSIVGGERGGGGETVSIVMSLFLYLYVVYPIMMCVMCDLVILPKACCCFIE